MTIEEKDPAIPVTLWSGIAFVTSGFLAIATTLKLGFQLLIPGSLLIIVGVIVTPLSGPKSDIDNPRVKLGMSIAVIGSVITVTAFFTMP